jgi:hypothetical protein
VKYTRFDFTESDAINAILNVMQTETVSRSAYHDLIAEATGAADEVPPILEQIMREEVFHSTLDWQSARQFRAGAKKAYRIYLADADFYRASARHRRARFHLFGAEREVEEARTSGSAERIAAAEAAHEIASVEEAEAREHFEALLHA